jgi:hypothetical protein
MIFNFKVDIQYIKFLLFLNYMKYIKTNLVHDLPEETKYVPKHVAKDYTFEFVICALTLLYT